MYVCMYVYINYSGQPVRTKPQDPEDAKDQLKSIKRKK